MIFYFNSPFLQVEKQVQKGKVTGPKLASTQLIIRSHDAELGKVLEIHAESFKEKWVAWCVCSLTGEEDPVSLHTRPGLHNLSFKISQKLPLLLGGGEA